MVWMASNGRGLVCWFGMRFLSWYAVCLYDLQMQNSNCTLVFIDLIVHFFARGFAFLCMTTVVFWRCNLNLCSFFCVCCVRSIGLVFGLFTFFFYKGLSLNSLLCLFYFFACCLIVHYFHVRLDCCLQARRRECRCNLNLCFVTCVCRVQAQQTRMVHKVPLCFMLDSICFCSYSLVFCCLFKFDSLCLLLLFIIGCFADITFIVHWCLFLFFVLLFLPASFYCCCFFYLFAEFFLPLSLDLNLPSPRPYLRPYTSSVQAHVHGFLAMYARCMHVSAFRPRPFHLPSPFPFVFTLVTLVSPLPSVVSSLLPSLSALFLSSLLPTLVLNLITSPHPCP